MKETRKCNLSSRDPTSLPILQNTVGETSMWGSQSNTDVAIYIIRKTVSSEQVLLTTHGHDNHDNHRSDSMPRLCYLESVFAVYVVIRLNRCNDITGQRDATEHRLLSAVCEASTHNTHRVLFQASETTNSNSAEIFYDVYEWLQIYEQQEN